MAKVFKDINALIKTGPTTDLGRKQIVNAVKAFFTAPQLFDTPGITHSQRIQNFRKGFTTQMQNWSTTDNFPDNVEKIFKEFRMEEIADMRYTQFYDIGSQQGQDSYTVYIDHLSNFDYPAILPGGKVVYKGLSGEKFSVFFEWFGDGVAIPYQLVATNQFAKIEKHLTALRNAAYIEKAKKHYALPQAVDSSRNVTWQTTNVASTDATYRAKRDAATLTAARNQLLRENQNKGYSGTGPESVLTVLCAVELESRLKEALDVRLQSVSESRKAATGRYNIIATTYVTDLTSYYVIIPGNLIQSVDLLLPTIFSEWDQSTYSMSAANWLAYGLSLSDQEQVCRCALS